MNGVVVFVDRVSNKVLYVESDINGDPVPCFVQPVDVVEPTAEHLGELVRRGFLVGAEGALLDRSTPGLVFSLLGSGASRVTAFPNARRGTTRVPHGFVFHYDGPIRLEHLPRLVSSNYATVVMLAKVVGRRGLVSAFAKLVRKSASAPSSLSSSPPPGVVRCPRLLSEIAEATRSGNASIDAGMVRPFDAEYRNRWRPCISDNERHCAVDAFVDSVGGQTYVAVRYRLSPEIGDQLVWAVRCRAERDESPSEELELAEELAFYAATELLREFCATKGYTVERNVALSVSNVIRGGDSFYSGVVRREAQDEGVVITPHDAAFTDVLWLRRGCVLAPADGACEESLVTTRLDALP